MVSDQVSLLPYISPLHKQFLCTYYMCGIDHGEQEVTTYHGTSLIQGGDLRSSPHTDSGLWWFVSSSA